MNFEDLESCSMSEETYQKMLKAIEAVKTFVELKGVNSHATALQAHTCVSEFEGIDIFLVASWLLVEVAGLQFNQE